MPRLAAKIWTNDKKTFEFLYYGLVDHILLLREVTKHPEMTQKGETFTYFIDHYCRRLGRQKIRRTRQQ